jgi:hypothetical protein
MVGACVEVETFYDDGTPAGNARVAVRDATRNLVAEGRTDPRGRWSFHRPAAGRYEVTVDAGAGHRTTVKITIPAATPAPDTDAGGDQGGQETTAAQRAEVVSEGPTREEFTRMRWLNVGIGLAAIALFSLAFWWARHHGGRPAGGPPSGHL